jgi:LSD1 subclass zinc finger protein
MPQSMQCPSCGAPLTYTGTEKVIRCPFCNNTISMAGTDSAPDFQGHIPVGLDLKGLARLKEVKALINRQDIEGAVALYREILGVDETQARQAVENMAAGRPVVLTNTNFTVRTTVSGDPEGVVDGLEGLLAGLNAARAQGIDEANAPEVVEKIFERMEGSSHPAAPSSSPTFAPSRPLVESIPGARPDDGKPRKSIVTGCVIAAILILLVIGCGLAIWFASQAHIFG